jgi:hypothetical protein
MVSFAQLNQLVRLPALVELEREFVKGGAA